jgi:hypothetical protein
MKTPWGTIRCTVLLFSSLGFRFHLARHTRPWRSREELQVIGCLQLSSPDKVRFPLILGRTREAALVVVVLVVRVESRVIIIQCLLSTVEDRGTRNEH